MYNEQDWTKAISKLVRLTVEKKLIWKLDALGDEIGRRQERPFYATHRDKTYVVSSFDQQIWEDIDEWHWEPGYSLEIWKSDQIKLKKYKIATSPNLPGLINLFSSIERQFAANEDALGSLLSDD